MTMNQQRQQTLIRMATVLLLLSTSIPTQAQTPAFTYQGRLTDTGTLANGNYDLQFALFDSVSGGSQIGTTQTVSAVAVTAGVFTVQLDFGASAFPGAVLLCTATAFTQTTQFTYQGRLTDGGTPASGNYDLQFALFDSLSTGTQIGATQTVSSVAVNAGVFTVQLDFGAGAFPGANRWLEIRARLNGAPAFTTLTPRQPITSTPYAIRSANASSADVVVVTGVPAGSGNYIQNTSTPQTTANFNISGNGTAGGTLTGNTVNTSTQYNIAGGRMLSAPGDGNTFVGEAAGQENTSGARNAFFGFLTGQGNTKGSFNSYFGVGAGRHNFDFNQAGAGNSFFGYFAGDGNSSGNNNSALGREATVGSTNLTGATAIGAFAQVDVSNSIVLGSIAGINNATASTNVGIGTTAPVTRLDVRGGHVTLDAGTSPAIFTSSTAGEQNRYLQLINSLQTPSASGLKAGGILVADSYGFANPGKNELVVKGRIRFGDFGINGETPLCRNASLEIALCNISSLRYKKDIRPYTPGLELIEQLQPITFNWKQNGRADVGLGAEDVAKVAPAFTFTNSNGEIEVSTMIV